jgi:hypothetical protein
MLIGQTGAPGARDGVATSGIIHSALSAPDHQRNFANGTEPHSLPPRANAPKPNQRNPATGNNLARADWSVRSKGGVVL